MKRPFKNYLLVFISCATVVALASAFASSEPDGLEYIAQSLGFIDKASEPMAAPMPDYSFPRSGSPFMSSFLAGLTGVGILYLAYFAFGFVSKKIKR